jgi:amino acid permease
VLTPTSGMVFVDAAIFILWVVVKRSWKFRKASEMDFVSDLAELEAYEMEYADLQRQKKKHFGHRVNGWLFD